MQQGVQTDATCNIQQSWELLANDVASVCTGLKELQGNGALNCILFSIQQALSWKFKRLEKKDAKADYFRALVAEASEP